MTTNTAHTLLDIQALGYSPDEPLTFKSGIVSPIYVDNRRLPYQPDAWHAIIDDFRALVEREKLSFDVIAGIETAGIPHGAALAYALRQPFVFVRKQPKDHGTKRRVEGGDVTGKRVLLVEDLITTGGSSLSGAHALIDEGAQVIACLAIFSYGFPQADEAFAQAGIPLRTLTTLPELLSAAQQSGYLSPEALATVNAWQHSITR